jgi:hypothetical protein
MHNYAGWPDRSWIEFWIAGAADKAEIYSRRSPTRLIGRFPVTTMTTRSRTEQKLLCHNPYRRLGALFKTPCD